MTTLPDWLVERAARGEVPRASRNRLESADPAELTARIEELRERDAAELRAHPADPAVAQIERAVERERERRAARRRRMQAGIMAAAGATFVLVLFMGRGDDERIASRSPDRPAGESAPPAETTRIKGDVRLMAFRKAGDRVERLGPGATVRAGDLVQLRYNGGGRRHGLIASIDGAGAVTLHFPSSDDGPTNLGEKTTDLPHAYALDDAPRFERFFFITDDEPIDVGRTLASLRALAGRPGSERALLDLPPRYRQVSLLLHKAR